jgi:hypothetical protein
MQFKLSKTAFQFMLGSMLVMTIATACNDTSSSKETKTDSTAVSDTNKMDTMKMDTAKTRPIVPPDQPAK